MPHFLDKSLLFMPYKSLISLQPAIRSPGASTAVQGGIFPKDFRFFGSPNVEKNRRFQPSYPAARVRLFLNAEPYYRAISQGLALGYRRAERRDSWLARIRLPETARYIESKLGRAVETI